jgi:putative flippase GtrA
MIKKSIKIAFIYITVSCIATAINIGSQALTIWLYKGLYAVQLSVLVGTAAGIPVKYVLEKKLVFNFKADNLGHDTRLFILYGFMGVFTTAVFWGIEFAFHHLFGTDSMRYLGGAIGLTIGSYIKYHLDKRYVFKQEQA